MKHFTNTDNPVDFPQTPDTRWFQLGREATAWCCDNVVYDPYTWNNHWKRRFCELIVQECIDYCGDNLSKTVGEALKIHFGIES